MNSPLKLRRRERFVRTVVDSLVRLFLVTLWLAAGATSSWAEDGPIAAAQSALQQQGYLSGKITGTLDQPTQHALVRFQLRHDIRATGELNAATLQALQKGAVPDPQKRPAIAAAITQTTAEMDREFLQQLDQTTHAEVQKSDTAVAPKPEPTVLTRTPQPAAESPRDAASTPRQPQEQPRMVASSEADADATDSHGTRIVRSKVATTSANGRTYMIESDSTRPAGVAMIEVRRAEPVARTTRVTRVVRWSFGED